MALLPLFSVIFFMIGLALALDVQQPGGVPTPRWVLYPLIGYPAVGLTGVVGGLLCYNAKAYPLALLVALAPLAIVVFGTVALMVWLVG